MELDLNLKQFATPKQWKYYCAYIDEGSYQKAANRVGVSSRHTIRDAVQAILKKAEAANDAGDFVVDAKSTLYSYVDENGVKRLEWLKEKRDKSKQDKQDVQRMLDQIRVDFVENLPKAKPVKPPKYTNAELVTQYNITDYHIGMKAWAEETGANWDLRIAEEMLIAFFENAIGLAASSEIAVFAQIGDFLHYDSSQPKTPTSGHIVDADSRFILMIRVAIRVLRKVIAMLLKKHQKVVFLCAEGNHDIYGSALLRESFSALYDDEPRIEIVTRPDPFYCFKFGNVSTYFHHGHKVKFEQLPDVFAAKFPREWGATEHRYGYMGHYHHERSKEFRGILMRQLRTLAAPDAHASGGGYVSERDSVVITYHKEYGKIREDVIHASRLEVAQ